MKNFTKTVHRRRRPKVIPLGQDRKVGENAPYYSKAIGRAIDVLESFSDDTSSRTLKEICELIRLPEPTLFRILFTLESRGYIVRNADGSFRLSMELQLGRQGKFGARLVRVGTTVLQNLAGRFNETANLGCLFEDRIQILDTVETFHEIRITNKPGRLVPPHCSALGKAIAAFQDRGLMDRIIEVYGLTKRTQNTIVDRLALLDEFSKVRAQGYAVDREECVLGGICFGAPIRFSSNRVRAALSISVPTVRFSPKREQEITEAIQEGARLIEESFSARLGLHSDEPGKPLPSDDVAIRHGMEGNPNKLGLAKLEERFPS